METIGRQVRLPFSTAFQIAMQGIKIRLGRALVTISGVVLGIAFLMNILTGSLITRAIAHENQVRQQTGLMMALVNQDIGDISGATIAVVGCGELQEHERAFLTQLLKQHPAELRGSGITMTGVTPCDAAVIGKDADLCLVLGNAPACPTALSAITAGMKPAHTVVLDTLETRTFAGAPAKANARELFFVGQQDEAARLLAAERTASFRTIWIVIISLLVTVIGIANALLMSVTERFKEIGTMKCLGALSVFIRQLFLIESAVIGVVGSVVGCAIGIVFPLLAYSIAYSAQTVLGSMNYGSLALMALGCMAAGTILSILAAIYPATIAARMIPAMALRSNV